MTRFAWQDEYSVQDAGLDAQHRQLLAIMNELAAEVERGERSLADVLPFLYGDWLIDHICTVDHEYVPYLQLPKSRSVT